MHRKLLTVASLACFTASAASAQSPLFGGQGEPAWSRMYHYFESRFGAVAADEMILVPAVAETVDWDAPQKVIRLMEMNRWGDTEPSYAWQYAPNASKRVSEGYGYFLHAALNSALAANGGLSETTKLAVTRSSDELDFARADYAKVQEAADSAYAAYAAATPERQRKSKRRYFREQAWETQIDAKRQRLVAATDSFELISKNIVDPAMAILKPAILKYQDPDEQIYLPPVKEALNQPDMWRKRYATFIGGDIHHFMTSSQPQTQNIDESQSTSTAFEQKWKASVSVKFLGLFRAGGASVEDTQRDEHVRNNTTKINISFTNVDTFPIVRSDWYSENVLSQFYNKLTKEEFNNTFGSNGQLELIPKTLLVARGMKFEIYADSTSLDHLYKHFQGGADAGIKVGWFTVGGSGSYSVTKSETRATKYSDHITFEDRSGKAKIIGVLAKRYGANAPSLFVSAVRAPAGFSDALRAPATPSATTQQYLKMLSPVEKRRVLSGTER